MRVYIHLEFDVPAEKSLENLHSQTQKFLRGIGVDVESSSTQIEADVMASARGILRVRYNPKTAIKEG